MKRSMKRCKMRKGNGMLLREYLKENGLEGQDGSLNCEWCHLEPQGESLRIR